MEISSHAIELYRVNNVKINIAIFTNLGYDHLDFHKSEENYFNSKLKLFTKLKKDSIAILNADDKNTNNIIYSHKNPPIMCQEQPKYAQP